VAGATKLWAALPFLAALIVLAPSGLRAQRKVVGGAFIGFVACCAPFLIAAPVSFFRQVVVTQAVRSASGFTFVARLADLTEIPGLSSSIQRHSDLGAALLALVLLVGVGAVLACWRVKGRAPWSALERLALWGALLVGAGLSVSPTYYYHYSAFMAPFVALVASSVAGRASAWRNATPAVRSILRPTLGRVATSAAMALLLGTMVLVIIDLPVAPQVGDAVSDAIPGHGCVLYVNPTLALLDNRFTSDVSGCPDVIDWQGQERVLDDGIASAASDFTNRHLQAVIGHWIDSSDAVVLQAGNPGLDSANAQYLRTHFARRADVPRGLRIFVRKGV
jgi:hypothetical protein